MNSEKGATLVEVVISSVLAATIVLAVASAAAQTNKKLLSETDRIEMVQTGRTMMDTISVYGRAAGANRAGVFANAPYTTTSVLPIPQASSTMVRLRSDYDDNGALGTSIPEDITISWNSGSKTLTAGASTFPNVSNFLIRYYDAAGTELTGPWDITANAAHGATLRSIARIQFQVQMESRHLDPTTRALAHQTITWDVTVRNQLTTL
jgi:Tfp pilus assembly protein PilV